MSRLVWDQIGERYYETGVKQVFYTHKKRGCTLKVLRGNGLISVTESPSEPNQPRLYADDIKYLNLISTEELGATIEAYTYPDEFAQ